VLDESAFLASRKLIREGCSMSDIWKRCEGQIVDNQFPLLQFLANTNHSAVFLTNASWLEGRKAAIKFISADIPAAEEQLGAWKRGAQLDHPHLLRLFQSGRFHIAGLDVLYIVMELADEDLSRFLPERGLTAPETRELLNPLVEALGYLHGKGLVHSHIKPSNLLATKDQLKLSSDTIFPIGHSRETHRDLDVYDAPENSTTPLVSAAHSDIWSLGVTVVEAMTQQVPALPFDDSAELALSDSIPEPFREIARHSLVRNPAERWTISEVKACLSPAPKTAVATASTSAATTPAIAQKPAAATEQRGRSEALHAPVSPLSVPLSTESAVPLVALSHPQVVTPRYGRRPPKEPIALPSYLIPIVLLSALVVGSIFAIPKFLHHVSEPSRTSNSRATVPVAKTNSEAPTKPAETKSAPKTGENIPTAGNEQAKKVDLGTSNAPASAKNKIGDSSVVYANSPRNRATTKSPADSLERGEVLEQVLPNAPAKALSTINGKVRVLVRAEVDPVGNVSSAKLEAAGPSKYFANLSLQAVEQWQFSSPVSDGHSLPSQWLIRFEFSRSGVVASPTQVLQQ
jgi:Protein kinase domain